MSPPTRPPTSAVSSMTQRPSRTIRVGMRQARTTMALRRASDRECHPTGMQPEYLGKGLSGRCEIFGPLTTTFPACHAGGRVGEPGVTHPEQRIVNPQPVLAQPSPVKTELLFSSTRRRERRVVWRPRRPRCGCERRACEGLRTRASRPCAPRGRVVPRSLRCGGLRRGAALSRVRGR